MDEPDVLLTALSKQGERFMDMFDDARPRKRQRLQSQPASISSIEERTDDNSGNSAKLQGQARSKTTNPQNEQTISIKKTAQRGGSKREKRMFMSGKADILAPSKSPKQPELRSSEQTDTVPNVRDLFHEVTSFGASGLDKAQRRSLDNARLSKLHASIEQRPRMPASVGRCAASKEKEKSQRALQEAIDLGLVQKHGSGKKSRQKASAERKRFVGGLYEDGGAFRAGKLDAKRLFSSHHSKHGSLTSRPAKQKR